ncbi:autophagy-related protein 27-domain-containing protein [Mycena alexandri]|uniref:Autophagy-related protein 27 n=1 Tax=Mycena alexandri TaxID=1745969 RepID=A0AAD6XE11_9AGAR|nr:autophagy-related protein 27-domain-containing protein [Mycena alexandri]
MRPRTCLLALVWSLTVNAISTGCNFTLANLEFDLCPLLLSNNLTISFREDTPPTLTSYRYAFGLDAPLKRDFQLPPDEQCPEGTRICLIVTNTRPKHPSEPSRIFQVVPIAGDAGLNPKAKLLPKVHADDLHEPLQVTFHGGLYNHQSQKASFQFHCDHDVNEPTFPEFSWQFNGTHSFTWRSKHACPRALPPGAPAPAPDEPDIDPPAIPPDDPDAGVGDHEPSTGPAHLSMPLKIFGVTLFIFALRLLFRWSRRLLSRARSSSSSKGFRPSPLNLVQWAREERLEEYDIDEGLRAGEETPLTPNSRATFTASQYGGAR